MKHWKVVIEDDGFFALDIGNDEILSFGRRPGIITLLDQLCHAHNTEVEDLKSIIQDAIKTFDKVKELALKL